MHLPVKLVFCVLVLVNSEEISFKNVSIKWKSGTLPNTVTKIPSSNSLIEFLPENTTEDISATIIGLVPTLFENSISDLSNLESLSLTTVGLEEIKPGAFKNLPKLKYLYLGHNKLKEISPETFAQLDLTTLNLDQNSISVLHPGAFRNVQIHHISASYNKLTQISGAFENVTSTSLNLYGNRLNKIEPGTFSKIAGLASLTLSENKLEEINPEVFSLPDLTNLDLSFNSIKILRPGDFKNLPKLTSLDVVANKLEEIPNGVFNNLKITHLKLNYNKIVKIASGAFDNMPDLSVLHIDHNNLTVWDNDWLKNCPNLAYIVAGNNQFEELPDEAFKNYPKLYSIDLQANQIKNISLRAFDKLENVVNFQLRDNQIESWDPALLGNDTKLGTLDLSNNKLKCIEGDLDEAFRNEDFVHLWGNPWSEECKEKIDKFMDRKEAQTRARSVKK